MKAMAIVLIVAGVGGAASFLAPALGCKTLRPAVAGALAELAAQVCLETDDVEICARKCADAASPPEP